MKLSEQLAQGHASGDFGRALEGYAERAEALEQTILQLEAEAGRLRNAIEKKYMPAGPAQAKLFGMDIVIDPAVAELPHGIVGIRFGRTS